MPYEPETPISPIIRDAFFDALNPKSSTAITIKEDGGVAIKANQPPPETKPKAAAGVTKPTAAPGVQPPAAAGPTPEQQALTPFAGFGPVLAALGAAPPGGVSAGTLTGLTPEQITGLLGAETQKQKLRQGTIGQLLRMPYMQALTAKALRPDVTKAGEQWSYGKDEEGNWIRTNVATGKTELITKGKPPEKPLVRSRGYNWTKKDEAGKTVDRTWLPVGKVPKGPGWERDPTTQIRDISDLPERKFAYDKVKWSGKVGEIIMDNLGANENEARIEEANEGSPRPHLFVFIKGWTDRAKRLRLPKGMVGDNFPHDKVVQLAEGETISLRNPKTGETVRFKMKGDEVVIVK